MKTQPPFDIACVILCGGRSSRMGEDKALLPFSNSNTLTQYQFDRLKPFFTNIYISSKKDKFDFLDDKQKQEHLILDEGEEFSPIVALQSILKKIQTKKVFIITVDTPLVKIGTIKTLINNSKEHDITVASTKRLHNLCGVFDNSCLHVIDNMLKEDIHKVGFLIKKSSHNIIYFEDENEFLNLNDKNEYKKAISIIS